MAIQQAVGTMHGILSFLLDILDVINSEIYLKVMWEAIVMLISN